MLLGAVKADRGDLPIVRRRLGAGAGMLKSDGFKMRACFARKDL